MATPDDNGWQDVVTESQVKLKNVGDTFIGTLQGYSTTVSGIPQAHFVNDEGTWFWNVPANAQPQIKQVPKGSLTRLEKTGTQDTGQATPMDLIRVQFKA